MNKLFLLILSMYALAVQAQVFDIVVAKDGSGNFTTINQAFAAVPTTGIRTTIFVKKGVYNEKVLMGAFVSNNGIQSTNRVISLIGESRDSVVISWSDTNGDSITYFGRRIKSGTPQSATLSVGESDFYMENVTVRNTSTTAQAVAIYNGADRQTFKNCKILGYQDTHYPKKGRRGFYYKTLIEGRTDFICGGGPNYFLQCTLKSIVSGGYVTAPEDITYKATLSTGKTLYYGFIFKNCDLVNDGLVTSGSVYLGRPWQNTSGSVYLNCRLGNHINSVGWNPWSADVTTVSMAEFRSQNATGTALADVSARVAWSMQLSVADVNAYLKLTQVYASLGSTTAYDPLSLVVGPAPISAVNMNGQSLQWSEVPGSKGYVVYANGSVIGFSTTGSYTDAVSRSQPVAYAVCAVGAHGNLSVPDGQSDLVTVLSLNDMVNGDVSTALTPNQHLAAANALVREGWLQFQHPTDYELFALTGQRLAHENRVLSSNLSRLTKGLYLLQAKDDQNGRYQTKIQLQ